MASGIKLSGIQSLESRSGSWNGAADGILAQLKEASIQKGQVISIDAHNSGPNNDAIFSAHFCTDLPGCGELDISYKEQNESYGWSTFYENLGAACVGKTKDQIISMTASCSSGGRSVMYVFSYDSPLGDSQITDVHNIQASKATDDAGAPIACGEIKSTKVVDLDKDGEPYAFVMDSDGDCICQKCSKCGEKWMDRDEKYTCKHCGNAGCCDC